MAFLIGLSGALSHILIKENKATFTTKQLRHYMIGRNNQLLCSALFFLSLLPQFLEWTLAGMSVRVFIWFATLAFSLIVSTQNRSK